MNTETIIIDEFTLGPGEIYIRPGKIPQAEMEDYMYKAGDIMGGCEMKYEYKLRELYDVGGNIAGTLRYGEKVKLKGKLCRVLADAYQCLTAEGNPQMSVLIVCPLYGDEALRIFMQGGITAGLGLSFGDIGGVDFEIHCGKGENRPRFILSGGAV